jgi:hypothetical protein
MDEYWDDYYEPYDPMDRDRWLAWDEWDDPYESCYDEYDLIEEDDEWDYVLMPRGRGNVERKAELERSKAIHCGHCPYNRKENAKRRQVKDNCIRMTCPRCQIGKVLAVRGSDLRQGWCSHCREYIQPRDWK